MPVTARPPFEEAQTGGSITIVYPTYYAYMLDENIVLNFDVLGEDYSRLTAPNAECSINIVDNRGYPIISDVLTYDAVLEYWYYNITTNLLIGNYNYYVHCTEGINAGYVSSTFEITADGQQIHEDLAPAAVLVLIPIFLAFLLMLAVFAVGEGHAALKIFMFLLSFISISVAYNYAIKVISVFYASTSLIEFVASDYAWYGWVIFMLIIYFVLYWIIQFTVGISQRRINKFQFEDCERNNKGWSQ